MDADFGEMLDTSPQQRRRYYAYLRTLSVEQRARKVDDLCRTVRELAVEGIRGRDPLASDDEVRRRLAELLYGEAAARLFRR